MDMERPSNIEIPEASRRPSLPTVGPFFDVRDVRISGVTDDPGRGLFVAELLRVARAALSEQASEQEIANQGYSDEELIAFGRFVDQVKNAQLEALEASSAEQADLSKVVLMDTLLSLIDDLEARRGVSVFNLEAVAQAVQDEIRATGMILAQVVVPPQTVTDGTVELRVYPGRLGSVAVANNRVYSSATLQRAFDDSMHETVIVGDIEERLRLINDLEGMDVSGVFVPGRNPGETELRLNVINERGWNAIVRTDNHGSAVTGRTRGLLGATWFSPTGNGDQLNVNLLRSEGPNEVTLASARYRLPVHGVRHFIEGGISRNEFTIGGVTAIEGDTRNYDAAFGTFWYRQRDRNFAQTVFASFKDSRLEIGPEDQNQDIFEVGTTLTYDTLIPEWRTIVDGSTSLRFGSITSGRFEGQTTPSGARFSGQDKNFILLSQTARIYKLFDVDLPLVDYSSRHSFLFRVNSQFTEQFLPAVNRTALGGADAVRSLLADDISVDKGVFASMQVYWEVPASLDFEMAWARQRFSEFLRPFVFYDWAYGVTKASNVNAGARDDTWFEFGGYGVGMEFNLDRNAQGNYNVRGTLAYAIPEKSRFGDPIFETIIDDENRIFFDLTVELDRTAFPGWFGGN